jgi:hypothetical protein
MGVNTDHVGGLYDVASAGYVQGAEPMGVSGAGKISLTFVAAGVAALTSLFMLV